MLEYECSNVSVVQYTHSGTRYNKECFREDLAVNKFGNHCSEYLYCIYTAYFTLQTLISPSHLLWLGLPESIYQHILVVFLTYSRR